jgi:hypothetical protein
MIRTAFDQGGELSAAVELRRLFPGITDNAHARARARTIAGWKPLPVTPHPVTALAPWPGSLERLPLLADHSAASAARIISARFAFVTGARASRLVILELWRRPPVERRWPPAVDAAIRSAFIRGGR